MLPFLVSKKKKKKNSLSSILKSQVPRRRMTIQWEDRNKKLKVDSFLIWTKQLLFHNLVMGMDISLIDSLTF